MRYLTLCLAGVFTMIRTLAQPLGTWQEHLPYNSVISLAATGAGTIYAATPYSLFSVNGNEQTIERYSRITGLAETGVRRIHYAPPDQLVIAYLNGNIDIIEQGKVVNVSDYFRTPVNADKTIYHIDGEGERCLLSTGFGVVVLNLEKKEIGDTWVIGDNANYTRVNACALTSAYYYAATEEGLKRAPRNGLNLADYRNWTLLSGTGSLPTGPAKNVLAAGDLLFVQVGSTLYRLSDTGFEAVYSDQSVWKDVTLAGNELFISRLQHDNASVLRLSTGGIVNAIITDNRIRNPFQAIAAEGSVWVADSLNGLLELTGTAVNVILPGSPGGIATGDIHARNREWWVATGNSISRFDGTGWQVYKDGQLLPSGFGTIGPLAVDAGGKLWAGSLTGGGLLRMDQQGTTVYKEGVLSGAVNAPGEYRVTGLAFDAAQRCWVSNDGAVNGLVVLYPDGRSQSFQVPFNYTDLSVGQLLPDEYEQLWIVSPGANGLFCYRPGTSIESSADDQWRFYKSGAGNGNLPSSNVLSIARDGYGFIWVGTDNGIGLIQCAGEVFSGTGCEAILPVVQRDNFPGYLFKGEAVQAIAVDGANRKWVGTRNGAWLISPDGDKTILRFTERNSPLPANDIRRIAIDPVDGTVIFSTVNGICSYKGDATAGTTGGTNVLVYPNPVPPGYNGMIAIRGLVTDAYVKITELNGRLVQQGRAAGGQFTWNGRDLNGRPVASGVYLVIASDESRKEQLVTKIVFIQQ